jgi:hypothetical protein
VSFGAAIPGRVVKSDLVIRDVCEECNNGVLSTLDEAARSALEPLLDAPDSGGVVLRADGAQLLRWVLKVAFNGQRASGQRHVGRLRRFVPFVIGDDPDPPARVDLLAAWVRLVKATEKERAAGEGRMVDVRDDKIAEQDCFGPEVAFAPVVTVGRVILQVLEWWRSTAESARTRVLDDWRRDMSFEVVPNGHCETVLHPSQMDSRTWNHQITMFRPGVDVEDGRRGEKQTRNPSQGEP